ncbi:MAG: type II toxin-antitoxin system RelE/ParE family toxin [Verrucomicrobiota bacterium]
MEVRFATEVREEVAQAERYYEGEVEGLGSAFIQILYESIQEIKKFPEASRVIRDPYRRFLTPRFPYGIIFRVEGAIIYVVAVAHLKRRPYYWKNRDNQSG